METGVEGAGRGTGRPCRHGRASQHGLRSIIWDLCSRDAKVLGWVCHPGPTSVERAAECCGAAIEYQEPWIECWTDG